MSAIIIILATTDPGSVIVAIGVIVLIGSIIIITLLKHDIDGALKMWAALGTLVGMVVGTMSTYFFATGQVTAKDSEIHAKDFQIVAAQKALSASEREKVQAGNKIESLVEDLNATTAQPETKKATVKKLEDVSRTLKDTSTNVQKISPESSPFAQPTATEQKTAQPVPAQPTVTPSP
jgi:peptidoglycan hydrolase CwlO-like protein